MPDGSIVIGALPPDVQGHFGTTLRSYVLSQYYGNQVTQPLIWQSLIDVGVDVSTGQIDAILHHGHERFHDEKDGLLPAARLVATHFHSDDTTARHAGQDYHTTVIGNEFFTVFSTTPSKSRINFLNLLCAPYTEYVLGEDAMQYLEYYDRAERWQKRLREAIGPEGISVPNEVEWLKQLDAWGITAAEPRRLVTEAALWGCLMYHDLYMHQPILSDDAGQFKLLAYLHALCWLHAERNVARLVPLSRGQHAALERVAKSGSTTSG